MLTPSLSARRAWIEIKIAQTSHRFCTVALRKESVDRNAVVTRTPTDIIPSLSARRAWIEMFLFLTVQGGVIHADIRFNFENCYSKKLSHKILYYPLDKVPRWGI